MDQQRFCDKGILQSIEVLNGYSIITLNQGIYNVEIPFYREIDRDPGIVEAIVLTEVNEGGLIRQELRTSDFQIFGGAEREKVRHIQTEYQGRLENESVAA